VSYVLPLAVLATVAASSAISYGIGYTTARMAARTSPERNANNG
jgi:hypothetical protein